MTELIDTQVVQCYPDGTPEGFPIELFAPIEGPSLVLRETMLRRKIDELQETMKAMPQTEIPVKNTFSGGVYAREIMIPKGTVVIGKVHLTEHLNICLKGDLTFLTIDGPKRMKGPAMFSAPAGTKKLAYANEDSIWVNVHPAISNDPEEIVEAITVDSFADFDRLISKADLEYKMAIHGYTPQTMQKLSEDESTLDKTLLSGVEVKDSCLHGKGLFATKNFSKGELICLAVKANKRTLAGRYSNHSPMPNCNVLFNNEEYVFVALQDIVEGDELTTDYGNTLATIANTKEVL
jgi:quercetin dioxygenase-like cupin family protein